MTRLRHEFLSTDEPPINITPLIDVVFVVLIMFIVIAPLVNIDQVELATAGGHKEEKYEAKSPVSIHVSKESRITVNGISVGEKELAGALLKAHQLYPNAKPQLFHDKRAPFGTYQTVKNALESAGFSELEIVLSP